jgi:signal transduction histidine kinase/ligand-binding sensor domain-containing protein
LRHLGLLLIGLLLCGPARPMNVDASVMQMNHRAFNSEQGAPTQVSAIAQTSDGTLWVGGSGLSRFDGGRFVPYPGPAEERLPSANVSSLLASPDGGLWIGYLYGGASFLKGGRVVNYKVSDGFPRGAVFRFSQDREGFLWAATTSGLARLREGTWEKDAEATDLPSVVGFLIDRAGTQWMATADALLARRPGERFQEVHGVRLATSARNVLAEAPDGRIWAAALNGLVRIDDPSQGRQGSSVALRGRAGRAVAPIVFDREGNLWAADRGVVRVPFLELARGDGTEPVLYPQTFSPEDGLTDRRVFAFLQDREGNVWVGTTNGLDRFSQSNVVRNRAAACELPLAIAAGDAASLWTSCRQGPQMVEEVRGGVVVNHLHVPELNVAYRDLQGTVWFGGPNILAHLDRGRLVTEPLPPQARDSPVQALARDSAGAMWVSVLRRGLFRMLDGAWSERGNLDGLPSVAPVVATANEAGVLWFGYRDNAIARVSGGQVQMFEAADGVNVGTVLSIEARGGEVWIGGELGVARFDGARFAGVHDASGMAFEGVSGIVRAQNGDLWLNGTSGISRILRQGIDQWVRDPARRVQVETFNHLDGVPGNAVQLRPLPSAVEVTDGRIWFSRTTGLVSIDTRSLVRNMLPPPVTIWSLSGGDRQYRNLGEDVLLPVHTTNVRIEYSAGSLTVPERVRFRSKLEGLDTEWQDVGARREALYTNLGPGQYSFRVIASNNDGFWNETGASIDFAIPPAFFQTRWFQALCGFALLAVLFGLYRVRVRHVAAQVRVQLETRLAERERIARDLHDTLLQGIQGLILKFQAVANRIPPGEPARQLMEQSLDRADKLLGESRDKVKELRPAPQDIVELSQALAAEGEQLAHLRSVTVRVSLHGSPRELQPIVREEMFLIGREALGNAFRHACAGHIEAEVTYGTDALHLRIRDDGQGIDTGVLAAGGRAGHFGLIGMRERAKKLGAHLEVWSKPGAGTEVNLRVPAEVAYKRSRTASRTRRWWHPAWPSSGRQL